jgi:two-component system cell cycle sensor histidine kinase/response regulator CckA
MPSLCVLLIEDHERDATLILEALRHAGYEPVAERVDTAAGLRAALVRQAWDLITCDDTLPEFSALAALALIRAHDGNVPVVVVSGQVGEELAAAFIRAGADDLVLKDNVQRLPEAVAQALRAATNRRPLPSAQAATDFKQMEEAVREAGASLEIAVTAARAGIWDWDLQTGETHYSESWRTLWGYSPAEFDGSMEAWSKIVHPDDLERLAGSSSAATAIADPTAHYQEEFRLRHKDGMYRWVLSRATVLRDAAGTPLRMVGAHVDISERKRAEDVARHNARQVQALFEASVDVIGILEADGTFRDISPSIRWLLGYEVSDVVGRNSFDFVHPDDRAALQAAFASQLAEPGHREPTRYRLQRADGSWVSVESTVSSMLNDPAVRGFVVTTRDITERTRLYTELAALNRELEARVAERTRQLTEAQERLNLVIDIASDGFWDWNIATGEMYYSPRWIELLGYDPHEVSPHARFGESLVHPGDMPRVRDALREHFEGRTTIYECQNRLRMQSGRYRWNLSRGRVVERAADGRPLRMVGVDVDLSEKKALEEQLLQAQKMEAVGQLAGGVAHDFNNQLFVIRGYCDLLLKHAVAQPPILESVEQIKHAVQRSAALTTQLLAFSRKQVLQPKVLNLNAELFGIEKMLRRLIGEDIQLTLIPRADVGHVKVDPSQLQQIVMNLAINARDAMSHGGMLTLETKYVELAAAYAQSHLEVRPGPYVVLAVSDTGHGMDRDTLARVFEPFFTTKGPGKGTGLGLATVHGIVKQSGGHIAVDSEPGHGTTFTIYLPRVDEPAETAARGAVEMPAGGSETILLVEDEPAVREVVRRILAAQGYRVLLATNGKHGLELAEHFDGPIHLLLTDIVMPEMDGLQLAQQLRAARPETAVIYMSGYAEDAIARHGVLAAELAFIPKPCPTNLLLRRAREILDARPPTDVRGHRVLVVDDSEDERILQVRVLAKAGCVVLDAGSGIDALDVLEREAVDAVVTDVNMPAMDGFALTEAIRRSPRLRALPVIIFSGAYTEEEQARSRAVGATVYLSKGATDQHDLLDILGKVL